MQAAEARFSIQTTDNPDFVFNNNIVYKAPPQMHFRLIIDDKLNFKHN